MLFIVANAFMVAGFRKLLSPQSDTSCNMSNSTAKDMEE